MSDHVQLRFDDGKDPGALRTIGELSQALDIRQHVLRYWEQQFPMLRPLKRSGGRRYYRPEDVALVEMIDRLVNREGYTLKGAAQAIAGKTVPDIAPELPLAQQTPAQDAAASILPELQQIRDRLARALAA